MLGVIDLEGDAKRPNMHYTPSSFSGLAAIIRITRQRNVN
jgi:hypothetical protein